MSTVGDVAVRVGADITPLQDGMAKGANSVRQFSSKTTSHLKGVTKSIFNLRSAAVAAAAVGLVALTKQATTTGHEIQNLARIANSSGAEFQRMSYGAGALGIEQEKLSDILKDVNDRIGDFVQTGGGPMKDFFDTIAPKVGVTADQFARLSGPQALQLFYSSLEKANLSQADMTFYLEGMASDLTALQPLLANNGKLLQEQGDRAERFGIVLSDIELEQLSRGAGAFREMGATIKMASTLIGASLVPYVEELRNRFANVVGEAGGFRPVIDNVVSGGITGFSKLADVIHGLKVVFKGVQVILTGFGAAVASVVQVAAEGFSALADAVIGDVNVMIGALNTLPKVDIAKVDTLSNGPFMQGLRSMADEARQQVGVVRSELHHLAMQPLPSDKAKQFLDDVKAHSREAAEEIVQLRKATGLESQTGVVSSGEGNAEEEKQKQALEAIKNRYVTEQQLFREHRQNMALIGEEWDKTNFESETEWLTVREQAEAEHLKKLHDLQQAKMKNEIRQTKMRKQAIGGALSDLTTLMNSSSRKQFEIGKAAATSQAGVDTYASAQGAYKALAGIPYVGPALGIAAAAAATAAGRQRIRAIRSQSFGGGGAGAVATGSNTAAVNAATTPVAQQQSTAPSGPTYNFVGIEPGKLYNGRDLAEALQDYIANGGQLNLAA